jgi:thiol-disulfide isomerase/thioredoxin
MRKIAILITLSFLPFCTLFGQNAVLHISISNSKGAICYLYIPGQWNHSLVDMILNEGQAGYILNLTKPQFAQLTCFDPADWAHKHFSYLLLLSPGDRLGLKADLNKPGFDLKVSGKGSNNNQPLMSAMESIDVSGFYRDTLPYRAINAINAAQKARQSNLNKYIRLYNPSPLYINYWKVSLRYYASDLYNNFKGTNKNYVWEAYYRNYAQWQKITDSLFSVVKLNNDAALAAFHYSELVCSFLLGERGHLSDEEYLHPEAFYREWYGTDTVEGKKQFSADRKNIPKEKIINRYFTGKTAECLYAVLLAGAADDRNPTNIPGIFGRFKEKYPNSKYIGIFKKSVDTIIAKQKHTLNGSMVFMAGNGTKFNTLDEVLAAMKGKTVLVDMWGTWCGPCREEIEKNSAAIRAHFKDKGLTYLYIANNDLDNREQWKKLIAYFDIEGMHLLANKSLTDDIMAKVKSNSYPTMFIIKKDGTFELSKTAYPIERDVLIKQLEDDLAL